MRHIVAGKTPNTCWLQACLDGEPVEHVVACLTGDNGWVDVLMFGIGSMIVHVNPETQHIEHVVTQMTTPPTIVRLSGVVTVKGEKDVRA